VTIWYFAYGSNLDHDRFRARVGEWREHRRAILPDHELRFSAEVTSEGGGGAIIQPLPGGQVFGGVYAITPEQIAAMDAVELGSAMNHDQRGIRRTATLNCDGSTIEAELYEVPAPTRYRAPSARYLEIITKGLADFGYGADVRDKVAAVAAAEPQDDAN
jgi:hypothetical protein